MAHRVPAHELGEQIGSDENRRDERRIKSPNVLRNCSVLNVREANQSVMLSSGVRNVGTGSLCPGPICDRIKVVTSHRVITCSRKTPTADVIWPQGGFTASAACLSMGEGDAHRSTFAFADQRRYVAGFDALCRKHLFLHHAHTNAPSAWEAAPAHMHTNGTGARCRRICIRITAFVAHRFDSNDCRAPVACFGFQKPSQSRLVFVGKLEAII
jgi:hypothetical protein